MLRIINKYRVWKTVNKYIKYYTNHTDREIPYIPFYKVKIRNNKQTYCLNEFHNEIYARLIFIAFNNISDEEQLDSNIRFEVSHYICNEVYRLHYTEIYDNELPQFLEVYKFFK